MIRINLLPVRHSRRQEAAKRELVLLGVGAAIVAFVCAVVYILLVARVNEVRAENVRVEKELEELKATAAKVDELARVNEELKRKLAIIDDLQKNRVGPVHLLDEVSTATPEKLYLTSLKQKEGKIEVSGYSASNEIISQFLLNLEKSDWIDDVYLNIIEKQTKDGFALRSFQITARMVVPDPNAAASPPEKSTLPPEEDTPVGAPPSASPDAPPPPPSGAANPPPPAGEAE